VKNAFYIALLLVSVHGFSSCAQNKHKIKRNISATVSPADTSGVYNAQATFAAGCFWHEETLFESIKGVGEVVSGYAGGDYANPSYEDVGTGTTGHAETVNIYYDSTKISFPQLVKVYFDAMDNPTQVNGQGPDHGTQYRSIIFYRNEQEKKTAEDYIAGLSRSGKYKDPIAVEVKPFTKFWKAEDYHQNYIDHNPDNPYVMDVSIPDIVRYQQAHPEMIKPDHSFVE